MIAEQRGGHAEGGVPAVGFDGCQSAVGAAGTEQLDCVAGPVYVFEMCLDAKVARGRRGGSAQPCRLAIGENGVVRLAFRNRIGQQVANANDRPA